jgi:four helix bundle protein
MGENIITTKTYQLSVDVVFTYKKLKSKYKEPDLFKQLLRSGTSISANVREARSAESDKDFIHKLSISRKETNETIFW